MTPKYAELTPNGKLDRQRLTRTRVSHVYIENLLAIVCSTTAVTDSVPIIASRHQNRQIDMNCTRKTIGKRVLFCKRTVLQSSYLLRSVVFRRGIHVEDPLKANFSGIYEFLEQASDLRERSLCRCYLASLHHVIYWLKFNSTWIVHYK